MGSGPRWRPPAATTTIRPRVILRLRARGPHRATAGALPRPARPRGRGLGLPLRRRGEHRRVPAALERPRRWDVLPAHRVPPPGHRRAPPAVRARLRAGGRRPPRDDVAAALPRGPHARGVAGLARGPLPAGPALAPAHR